MTDLRGIEPESDRRERRQVSAMTFDNFEETQEAVAAATTLGFGIELSNMWVPDPFWEGSGKVSNLYWTLVLYDDPLSPEPDDEK